MRLPHHRQKSTATHRSNSERKYTTSHPTTYTQSDYFIIELFHCTASQPTDFHQIRHKFYVFRRKSRNDFYHPEIKKKRHSTRDIQSRAWGWSMHRGSNRSSIIKTLFQHENFAKRRKKGRARKNYEHFHVSHWHIGKKAPAG